MAGEGVCIVTSGHVASDPRVVKMADALAGAGYRVTVVAADITPSVRTFDRALMRERSWPLLRVTRGRAWWWHSRGLLVRAARLAWRAGLRHGVLPRLAVGRLAPRLAAVAVAQRAQLYIGVNMDGAVGALEAAEASSGALAFDAVDDHPGEVPDVLGDADEIALRTLLMQQIAARCAFRTTSAPMTADALRARTRQDWLVLRNVFPRADADGLEAPAESEAEMEQAIYWFSQTIGPGRGIEALLAIVAHSKHRWRIDLRGTLADGYETELQRALGRLRLGLDQVRLLPPAGPGEMTRLAAGYALGASVEAGESPNRRQCLCNKIFQYLLAGTPVLLSATPAQRELAGELGAAALLVDLQDAPASARLLDEWWGNRGRRAASREAAWRTAHGRLNWDVEKASFLAAVRQVIGDLPGVPRGGSGA